MNKKFVPWVILGFFGLYAAGSLRLPAGRAGEPDFVDFGRLPALHNGRVKPLDTIARSTLLILRGKQTLTHHGHRVSAIGWMADVMAKPELADNYKVFVIHDPDILGLMGREQTTEKYFSFNDLKPFLPEFQAQAAQADAVEAAGRSRYQRDIVNLWERLAVYQRLKNTLRVEESQNFPEEIEAFRQSVAPGIRAMEAHQKSKAFNREALVHLGSFLERYQTFFQVAYFNPLAPAEGDLSEHWINMGEGLLGALRSGEIHPDVFTYAVMSREYAASQWAAFNLSVKSYEQWLKKNFPRTAAKARYETIFNHAEPFYQGMVIYVTVLLLSFFSWLVWPDVFRRAAYYLLLFGFVVHSAGLISRIVLQGRPPVTNLYSSAIFVGWVAVLLGVILERIYRKGFGNVVAAVVGFATLIVAHHLTGQGDTMEMMRAVLDSNFWLATHVVTITIGYSSTFLAGALGCFYIFRGFFTATLDKETGRTLTQMAYGVICFSLFFSFVGTVLGGIWADQSWGRFWGWDPKENGALMIVLWNALILHARWGNFVRERGVMVMAVFGNIITSLSWFGVNMLGIGLHSYGFMDKAFMWLALFVVSQVAIMGLGGLPLERWRSFKSGAWPSA